MSKAFKAFKAYTAFTPLAAWKPFKTLRWPQARQPPHLLATPDLARPWGQKPNVPLASLLCAAARAQRLAPWRRPVWRRCLSPPWARPRRPSRLPHPPALQARPQPGPRPAQAQTALRQALQAALPLRQKLRLQTIRPAQAMLLPASRWTQARTRRPPVTRWPQAPLRKPYVSGGSSNRKSAHPPGSRL